MNKQNVVLEKELNLKWINNWKLFHLIPQKKPVEEGKWLLGVTSFETTNSVFDITNETIVLQLQRQGIGIPEVEQKLITNYKNYYSLDLEMILNYM